MQGANTTTFKALLQHFQVEELEERLENKWGGGSSTKSCTATITTYTEVNPSTGWVYNLTRTPGPNVPTDQECPEIRRCVYTKPGGLFIGCNR